ncbi:hypothetical protein GCM10010359_07600 [Streptomyces morookaense]|nr:hypothetical protein GCM10010359_07600 [Streptomyces morookaense]
MRQRLLSATATALACVVLTAGGTGAAQAATAAPAHTAAPAVAPADDPTPDEQAQLRVVAAAIWNQQLADGWNMNSDVADVLSQATGAILKCSEAFALVPKPPGGVVPGQVRAPAPQLLPGGAGQPHVSHVCGRRIHRLPHRDRAGVVGRLRVPSGSQPGRAVGTQPPLNVKGRPSHRLKARMPTRT